MPRDKTRSVGFLHERKQGVSDRHDWPKLLSLLSALRVQADASVLEVHLCRGKVKHRVRSSESVQRNHTVNEQVRDFLRFGQQLAHLSDVEHVSLFGVASVRFIMYKRGSLDLAPLIRPIDCSTPYGHDTGYIGVFVASCLEPFHKFELPGHRQLVDSGWSPEVYPQGERDLSRFGGCELMSVRFPIPHKNEPQGHFDGF
ncbi:hypothetical protein HFO74_27230 [Rhizobium laguerreae]|uniref:Uncharacterized protein n=1 Tax=Rhizobium laguerreae TaxID=1076926 RepID=A0AB35FN53_9HYPH|nr:hypothetical protein [Rhizobium laguerreae]MBY3067071.1 hypothetical protein [Rhizobium laguerreae]